MSTPKLRFAAVLAAFVLVVAGGAPATAGDDPPPEFGTTPSPDDPAGVDVDGSQGSDSSTGGGDYDGSTPAYTVPKPYQEYAYAPACDPNSGPDNDTGAGETPQFAESGVLCGAATMSCPVESDIRYRVYTRWMTADGEVAEGERGEWTSAGTQCRGADDPPEGGPPVITTEMIVDAARAVAPEPQINVEPADRSYVNVPTNVYASDETETVTVEVLGVSLPVRFAPASFRWSFGDGGSGSGAGVRNAAVGAAGAVEHQYRRAGSYDITLSRTYDVTVQLPGGETLELPTQLSNESEPYSLDVGEIQSVVTDVD